MTKDTITETAALKALLSETADHQILAEMLGFVVDRLVADQPARLIKTGARVVSHACAITFQPAEVAISSDLFVRILAAIQRLRAPPVPA